MLTKFFKCLAFIHIHSDFVKYSFLFLAIGFIPPFSVTFPQEPPPAVALHVPVATLPPHENCHWLMHPKYKVFFKLWTIFCWHEINSCALGYELYTKLQLINSCQQMVIHNLMDHPVLCANFKLTVSTTALSLSMTASSTAALSPWPIAPEVMPSWTA